MSENSRQAWVDAVAAGETTDSFVDWWVARERKVLEDEEEGGELIAFSVRLGVTTRAFCHFETQALSLEEAIAKTKAIPVENFRQSLMEVLKETRSRGSARMAKTKPKST